MSERIVVFVSTGRGVASLGTQTDSRHDSLRATHAGDLKSVTRLTQPNGCSQCGYLVAEGWQGQKNPDKMRRRVTSKRSQIAHEFEQPLLLFVMQDHQFLDDSGHSVVTTGDFILAVGSNAGNGSCGHCV